MSSSQTKTAPYGSWKSPITSDLIVAQSIALSDVRLDGGHIYWLEGRPQEHGRSVVVRAEDGWAATDITPAPFNARTRVHEYGGGSWTVRDGTVYFSNFADGRLYRQAPDASAPQPLTPAPPARDRQWRFADGVIDHRRNRWIGVREDHTAGGEPVNTIVAVDLDGGGERRARARERARFLCVAAAVAGRKLARLAGVGSSQHAVERHHALPRRRSAPDGVLGEPQLIAGGATRIDLPAGMVARRRAHRVRVRPLRLVESLRLRPGDANDAARWRRWRRSSARRNGSFGMSTYAFAGPERIVCAYTQAGLGRLAVLDLPQRRVARARHPVHRIRLGAGGRATASCFAPARPTIPPASSRSILAPAGTPC